MAAFSNIESPQVDPLQLRITDLLRAIAEAAIEHGFHSEDMYFRRNELSSGYKFFARFIDVYDKTEYSIQIPISDMLFAIKSVDTFTAILHNEIYDPVLEYLVENSPRKPAADKEWDVLD